MPPLRDLVAIVGTTGVGKTQLAVDLATALPSLGLPTLRTAEVINSDSMQVYAGLDVITNKATRDEMLGVPHHLMGFLQPGEEYQVGQFQKDAMAKIGELVEANVLPVVVGGTTYYLQHLLFPNQLVTDTPPPLPPAPVEPGTPGTVASISHFPTSLQDAILSLPAELLALFLALPALPQTSTPNLFPPEFPLRLLPALYRDAEAFSSGLYSILVHVDPKSASRWHWRDVRKVRRALDIVWEGRQWQDVLNVQSARKGEGARFRTLIFWLFADKDTLEERLDARVDKMLERGLLQEIHQLRALKSDRAEDYSVGIYQAIGYKEFSSFLDKLDSDPSITTGDPLVQQGVEAMKLSTRQYAKKQVKWIKKKLLPAVQGQENPDVTLYLLDATNLASWSANVRDPALQLVKSFLLRQELPDPSSLSSTASAHLGKASTNPAEAKEKVVCEACTKDDMRPFLVEAWQWDAHRQTKAHRKLSQRGGSGPRPLVTGQDL